eukprot:Hpha_TRINITY_DN18095_c0_g1::TRINITY_DN18095_c0_g1_i1::g.1170::m.1170
MWWCGARGVPCVHYPECAALRKNLGAAADAAVAAGTGATLTRGRAATIAPQWCKLLALQRILKAGYAAVVVDADVALLTDPIPRVAQLLSGGGGSLLYQCGERDLTVDKRILGGFSHWPNTGHLAA